MRTVIISAGHSNGDSGAVSKDGKHKESDLVVRLRNRVATLLRADGEFRVVTDGAEDENRPLRDAIELVKANPTALAVEIHFNSGGESVRGVEVLAPDRAKFTGQMIAAAISAVTGSPRRGVLGWKPASASQHHRLGFCEAGGLVIEVEFLSNPTALEQYLRHEDEVATSLANALRDAAREDRK